MYEVDLNNVVTIPQYAKLKGWTVDAVVARVNSGFLKSVPLGESSRVVVLTAKELKKWQKLNLQK
jgi:hypothetical protein